MTRAEISALLEPATFKPFVLVTHAGRFRVPHPDFIDMPPHDAEEPEPQFHCGVHKNRDSEICVVSITLKSNQSPRLERGTSPRLSWQRYKTEDTDG